MSINPAEREWISFHATLNVCTCYPPSTNSACLLTLLRSLSHSYNLILICYYWLLLFNYNCHCILPAHDSLSTPPLPSPPLSSPPLPVSDLKMSTASRKENSCFIQNVEPVTFRPTENHGNDLPGYMTWRPTGSSVTSNIFMVPTILTVSSGSVRSYLWSESSCASDRVSTRLCDDACMYACPPIHKLEQITRSYKTSSIYPALHGPRIYL